VVRSFFSLARSSAIDFGFGLEILFLFLRAGGTHQPPSCERTSRGPVTLQSSRRLATWSIRSSLSKKKSRRGEQIRAFCCHFLVRRSFCILSYRYYLFINIIIIIVTNRCGHCKALKPAWDKLGDEYDGSSTVLIGDVDCTVHQNLCQKFGVQGYPTLKYFTANPMGDAYNGGRDYEELSKFAKESLGPSCGVEHMDLCDAEQKKSLETKMALSDAELDKLIEDSDAKLKQADEDLEALLKGLQASYEDGKKAKEDAQAALSPELAQLRSVKRSRENGAKQEL